MHRLLKLFTHLLTECHYLKPNFITKSLCTDRYLMMNDASYCCDNVRVKRVRTRPSVSFDPGETRPLQTDTCFPSIAW